jgi:muconolactone D-isomerase
MLYLVHMRVELPHTLAPAEAQAIKEREKAYARRLQEEGAWIHLWRVAGEYANYSVFDVEDHDALHALLSALPLFPYMRIEVTPLARHPSSIR